MDDLGGLMWEDYVGLTRVCWEWQRSLKRTERCKIARRSPDRSQFQFELSAETATIHKHLSTPIYENKIEQLALVELLNVAESAKDEPH